MGGSTIARPSSAQQRALATFKALQPRFGSIAHTIFALVFAHFCARSVATSDSKPGESPHVTVTGSVSNRCFVICNLGFHNLFVSNRNVLVSANEIYNNFHYRSAAARCGLRIGDKILRMNGNLCCGCSFLLLIILITVLFRCGNCELVELLQGTTQVQTW